MPAEVLHCWGAQRPAEVRRVRALPKDLQHAREQLASMSRPVGFREKGCPPLEIPQASAHPAPLQLRQQPQQQPWQLRLTLVAGVPTETLAAPARGAAVELAAKAQLAERGVPQVRATEVITPAAGLLGPPQLQCHPCPAVGSVPCVQQAVLKTLGSLPCQHQRRLRCRRSDHCHCLLCQC